MGCVYKNSNGSHPECQTTRELKNREFDYGEYAEPLGANALASQNMADFLSRGEKCENNVVVSHFFLQL